MASARVQLLTFCKNRQALFGMSDFTAVEISDAVRIDFTFRAKLPRESRAAF